LQEASFRTAILKALYQAQKHDLWREKKFSRHFFTIDCFAIAAVSFGFSIGSCRQYRLAKDRSNQV